MKLTTAEIWLIAILVLQTVLVLFHREGINHYLKIYEDILGIVALFLLILTSFTRAVATYIKETK